MSTNLIPLVPWPAPPPTPGYPSPALVPANSALLRNTLVPPRIARVPPLTVILARRPLLSLGPKKALPSGYRARPPGVRATPRPPVPTTPVRLPLPKRGRNQHAHAAPPRPCLPPQAS